MSAYNPEGRVVLNLQNGNGEFTWTDEQAMMVFKQIASQLDLQLPDWYQLRCGKSAYSPFTIQTFNSMFWALGLAAEVGELLNILKKWIGHGREFDRDRVIDEAGDVLWYFSQMLNVLNIKLSEVMAYNQKKLDARLAADPSYYRSQPNTEE